MRKGGQENGILRILWEPLNDDGRCPWDDCPHNAIIDAMAEAKKADAEKVKASEGGT